MAEDNIDDILTRLDQVEKLQAELRHVVPRVKSGSSFRHQDLSRDSPTSIRFPSLFTFPVISNFTSTSKNERVQKSAARLNLTSKSLGGNRHSTVNLRNAGSSQSGTRETNVFKNLLRINSYARNSSASTSIADSKAPPTRTGTNASRVTKDPQETIKKRLKGEMSKTAVRDKKQRATGERSNVQLPKNENVSDSRAHGIHAMETLDTCLTIRNRHCDRSGTLIEQIIKKLNYCFMDDKRVTVPCHHLGSKTPRKVQMLHLLTIKGTEIS